MKTTPKKKATSQRPRALDDTSDIEAAFWAGLRPDPRPQEDEDGEPHPDPL
jgi:hypothetical protein